MSAPDRAGGAQPGTRPVALYWTLAALSLAMLPHVPHLPVWTVLLVIGAGAWRVLAERRRWRFPPRGVRFPLAIAVFLIVLASYRTINGVEAGSALLTVMSAMKLLETRTLRDQRVLLFIAFFMIMAGFLYGQSLWLLPYTAVTVWVVTTGLLQAGKTGGTLEPRRATALAGRLLLQAVPFMLVLFVLFPRVPGQFWALPAQAHSASSGLDDEMTPGNISDLSLSDEVAFRVKFDGDVPPPHQRYWRGPVLHEFDTGTWRAAPAFPAAGRDRAVGSGKLYRYRMTLEPHRRRWLFALEMPQTWTAPNAAQTFDYQLVSAEPVRRLIAYDIASAVDYRAGTELAPRLEAYDLALPGRQNPRARALASRLRAAADDDADYVRRVLDHFRREGFAYTLEPPRLGPDPVDWFLFETRQGFCGHYASAFTFLMRAGGVPARIVTGYLGGERNPLGDYYIVRQSDAHAWSEVWLSGRGWSRVDPTATVAPDRLQESTARVLREGTTAGLLPDNALFRRLRQIADALDNQWNHWVIGYNAETQQSLLSIAGIEEPDWRKLTVGLALLLAALLAGLSWYLAREFRPRSTDAVSRLYARFCRRLARRKLARQAHEGPVTYAARVARARPDLAGSAGRITRLYVSLRYEAAGTLDDVRALRRLVSGFRP